jgi:hypothetical protein
MGKALQREYPGTIAFECNEEICAGLWLADQGYTIDGEGHVVSQDDIDAEEDMENEYFDKR